MVPPVLATLLILFLGSFSMLRFRLSGSACSVNYAGKYIYDGFCRCVRDTILLQLKLCFSFLISALKRKCLFFLGLAADSRKCRTRNYVLHLPVLFRFFCRQINHWLIPLLYSNCSIPSALYVSTHWLHPRHQAGTKMITNVLPSRRDAQFPRHQAGTNDN